MRLQPAFKIIPMESRRCRLTSGLCGKKPRESTTIDHPPPNRWANVRSSMRKRPATSMSQKPHSFASTTGASGATASTSSVKPPRSRPNPLGGATLGGRGFWPCTVSSPPLYRSGRRLTLCDRSLALRGANFQPRPRHPTPSVTRSKDDVRRMLRRDAAVAPPPVLPRPEDSEERHQREHDDRSADLHDARRDHDVFS